MKTQYRVRHYNKHHGADTVTFVEADSAEGAIAAIYPKYLFGVVNYSRSYYRDANDNTHIQADPRRGLVGYAAHKVGGVYDARINGLPPV